MERLIKYSKIRIENTVSIFYRFLYNSIDWNNRLIAITGSRGVGKTTLMLQKAKELTITKHEVLFISLDDIYFSENSLLDITEEFVAKGGQFLFMDEVHKYLNWSKEIKTIYDTFDSLTIVFSSSSILDIFKGKADLSRRVVEYHLPVLSFREFLLLYHKVDIPVISLNEIITNHTEISLKISSTNKVLKYFEEYLKGGIYPFYQNNYDILYRRINEIITLIIEMDIPSVLNIDFPHVVKIKLLLSIISGSVPFKPNLQKIAQKTNIERATLYKYLNYLERSGLINQLLSNTKGMQLLTKPEKIYLENTVLMYALSNQMPEKGNIRETFFMNQLSIFNKINYTEKGDFIVNNTYIFEIGGKNKDSSQIKNIKNSYLALDDIEIGINNKIPLWLFGLLY